MPGPPAELAVLSETVQGYSTQVADLPGGHDAHSIQLRLEDTDLHTWVEGDGQRAHEPRRDCPCGPDVRPITRETGGEGAVIAHQTSQPEASA